MKPKQRKQIFWYLNHINCPSKRLLEQMNVIEAEIILMFVLLSYLPSSCRSNFLIEFSSSPRVHESILMISLMRHLQRSLEFGQCRKKWDVDSASKLQEQSGFIVPWKSWFDLCFQRWLKLRRNLVRSLIPRLSGTLNKLLRLGLKNFSNWFLKTSCGTDFQISTLKSFHSLIVYGKYKLAKHSVLQDMCRNLPLLLVW